MRNPQTAASAEPSEGLPMKKDETGRSGAAPNPDLFPANNPVLRPPVVGRVGLRAKPDNTSLFKDYVVSK